MAGKHDGFDLGTTSIGGSNTPVYPGTRDDRAYSEGRQVATQGGSAIDNPHPNGTPENGAWTLGFFQLATAGAQVQTCWVTP